MARKFSLTAAATYLLLFTAPVVAWAQPEEMQAVQDAAVAQSEGAEQTLDAVESVAAADAEEAICAPSDHRVCITTDAAPASFKVELAKSPEERAMGLMYRRSMAEDAGMFFVFEEEVMGSFWMKNTLIPLDIAFVRADGVIANIHENVEPLTLDHRKSTEPVKYVLEVNGGQLSALGVKAGDRILHPSIAP